MIGRAEYPHPTLRPRSPWSVGANWPRMTHQAAIAMGQSLRVLAAGRRRSRRPQVMSPDVVIGSHTGSRGACVGSPPVPRR